MTDAALALVVPDPRTAVVPADWWQTTALPTIEACTSWEELDRCEGQLNAMADVIESLGGNALEFRKALRVVEYRRGKLLRPEVTKGQRLNFSVPRKVAPATATCYREIARHWRKTLYPYLTKATDPKKVSQSHLLQLIHRRINQTKVDDLTTRAVASSFHRLYDVVVIDPPWPMEKIERTVRPKQSTFDYPTMTEEQLSSFRLPTRADCHVWIWTTQRFLPMAFRLLSSWNLKYVCTFVWHKPGGFQPVGLPQYNCEFALYARKGSPTFVSTRALATCFHAKRGGHSEKPATFYNLVRRVTTGHRVDIFNRRKIKGFDGWGNEAA